MSNGRQTDYGYGRQTDYGYGGQFVHPFRKFFRKFFRKYYSVGVVKIGRPL